MAKTKKKPGKGRFGSVKQGKIVPTRSGAFNPTPAPGRVAPPAQGKPSVGSVAPPPPQAGQAGQGTGTAPAPGVPGWEADPAYQLALSQQQLQQQQADAQYQFELAQLGSSTGLFNADGSLIDQGQVEQLNPFSRAGLLRRSWREAQRGGVNSYAAAGQLYSGALKNAVGVEGSDLEGLYDDQRGGYNSFGYQANLGGLKQDYNQRKSELDRWRLGVGNDAAASVSSAAQGATERFIEARPPTPAPPRNPAAPPSGYGVPSNKGQPFTPLRVPRRRAGRMVLPKRRKPVRGPGSIRQVN